MRRLTTGGVVWSWVLTGVIAGATHGVLLSMAATLSEPDGRTLANVIPLALFGLLFPGLLVIPGQLALGAIGGGLAVAAWAALRSRLLRPGIGTLLCIAGTLLAVAPDTLSRLIPGATWRDPLIDSWWIQLLVLSVAVALSYRATRRSGALAEKRDTVAGIES